jgi:serine/threonine protein kinase/WD40 repeat protein
MEVRMADSDDDDDDDGGAVDPTTWSAGATGSGGIGHQIERELVRAALFDRDNPPQIAQYRIGERLGAGASSVVHAARDLRLDRQVAIKIFLAETSATQQQVLRESRALAQLKHHNVVTVYDVGEWNDHAFIAMELILGATLARWQAAGARSTHELLSAYLQAGRGLEAAHRAGLVHRDFKPANVMVADDGRVVVTDFGLVSHVATGASGATSGSAADTHSLVGTPAYVAPEQLRGTVPHPSADIYSFALALCEALTGRHPMDAPATWRRTLARKVPPRLHAAICAGLAVDPAARGSSITPLLAALAHALPGRARAATPPWLDGLLPARRRWPARAAIVATGLAAAAGARMLVDDGDRGDGDSARWTEMPGVPVFDPPRWSELRQRAASAHEQPPPYEGTREATSLRTLVLHPLPTALRCAWPGPIQAPMLGDGYLAARDEHGRVLVCSLKDGTVSLLARDARCVVRAGPGAVGVLARTGDLQVHREDRGRWRRLREVPRFSARLPDNWAMGRCLFALPPDPDGDVEIIYSVQTDHAARLVHRSVPGRRERHIVDLVQRSVVARITLPSGVMIRGLAGSRDGASAVLTTSRRTLLWWPAGGTGWQPEPIHFQDSVVDAVRMSPDGRRALLISDFGSLEVRTLGGGETTWLARTAITDAVFLDDDTVIALDTEHRIWRWHLPSLRSGLFAVYREPVWSVASNAEVIASGSEDGTATVVDRRTGELRLRVSTGDQIYKVELDGDHLVVAGNGGLYLWNWRTGERLPSPPGRHLRIWDLEPAVAPDGSRIYLTGAIRSGDFSLWTSHARSSLGRISASNVHNVALAADGRTAAATSSTGELILIDVPTMRILATGTTGRLHDLVRLLFDATTGTFVTSGEDGYLTVWSSTDASRLRDIRVGEGASYGLDVQAGRAIVASGTALALIDLATGRILRQYSGHRGKMRVARFSPDGGWFVTGDEEGGVCLWQIENSECHTWLEGHRKTVNAVEFTDDGTVFTTSHDGTVRFWRPTYDRPVTELHAELARHSLR